jgi:hypothetical protein
MSKREPSVLLEDIRVAISKIERYIAGLDQRSFLVDEKTIDAVIRNLEIIGEAVKQLPAQFKMQHATIPWSQLPDCAIASCTITLASISSWSGISSRQLCPHSRAKSAN